MIFATTDKVEGKEHEVLDMVKGSRSELAEADPVKAIELAKHSMEKEALELNADAIVGIKIVYLRIILDIIG